MPVKESRKGDMQALCNVIDEAHTVIAGSLD
jgi:hypothetical protein